MTNDRLHAVTDVLDGAALLTVAGTLDSVSYLPLRDHIIKCALDAPNAVIVDITKLATPAESALAVFTRARWHITRWPDVPLLLVCGDDRGRNKLNRNGVTRYVPAYTTTREALEAVARQDLPVRRRVRVAMSPEGSNVSLCRRLVEQWLQHWSCTALIPVAKVVVTAIVENAMQHAGGAIALRLETKNDEVTVAVEDGNVVRAAVRENGLRPSELSSLKIVAAVCRAWGCSPTANGKVVWCVIGPENRL